MTDADNQTNINSILNIFVKKMKEVVFTKAKSLILVFAQNQTFLPWQR